MTKLFQFLMGSFLLIGLTSCGHQEVSQPQVETPSVPVKPKPKPQKEVAKPSKPTPQDNTRKVGLLVPLSGPHADLGKGMRDAAEMALFENGTTTITLLPQDTAKGAHRAALKALDEGAELLLGPLFASEVEAVKPLVNARNVNLIAFSTDQSVAGNGTFIIGFLPSQQIERVTSFVKEKGLTKVAALTPEDQYGKLIDQTLHRLNSQGHIQLLGITHYTKGDLLEGNPGNARLLEEIAAYKSKGMEALLLPEGGENLGHLTQVLSSEMPMKILGSGQWDTPETLRIAPRLQGAVFASTYSPERQNFEERFQKAYGYAPPRIATLAYDATALASALANQGYTTQNLTFSQGFAGVDGVFRLTPQGLNERSLGVLEVTPTGFKSLSPAASTF